MTQLTALFSNDTTFYKLPNNFSLHKAVNSEFIRWWAVYRDNNEDFSQSFASMYGEIEGVPYCYWIHQHETRIGGVIILPNNIGDPFLIPPYTDMKAVVRALMCAIQAWSNPDQPIVAQSILDHQLSHFQRVGFVIEESRHWMIRPTQTFDVQWNGKYQLSRPQKQHIQDLAELFHDAFYGGVGSYGERTIERHTESIEDFYEQVAVDEVCYNASTLVYEGENLLGACLVQQFKDFPTIRFVTVRKSHQGQGIATQLIYHALTTLKETHDYVTLAVTVGNAADALYDALGFLATPTMHRLKLHQY